MTEAELADVAANAESSAWYERRPISKANEAAARRAAIDLLERRLKTIRSFESHRHNAAKTTPVHRRQYCHPFAAILVSVTFLLQGLNLLQRRRLGKNGRCRQSVAGFTTTCHQSSIVLLRPSEKDTRLLWRISPCYILIDM